MTVGHDEIMEHSGGISSVSVHAPRMLAKILDRHRIIEGLLPLAAITVVRGPGGAGKTVLLSQLVTQSPEDRGGWITVDEVNASRTAFWRHVIERTLGKEASLRVVGERLVEPEPIINCLKSAGLRLVIVIDDAHLVSDPVVFHDILAIVRAVPAVSFVLATRTVAPALEDHTEALSLDIRVVTPQELQFTTSEIAEVAGVSHQRADEFRNITAGNALLLRALQLGVRRHAEDDAVAGAVEVLRGYLRRYQESVGETLTTFMQRTSLSDDFSLAEAKQVSGQQYVTEMLAQLESAGLLTRQAIGEEDRFRYHPLVREFLLTEITAAKRDDIGALHGIVARQRAKSGDDVAALRHSLLARDFDLASRILLLGGTDLLQATPYEAIANVPLRIAAHHPLLAASRALKENARGSRWISREFFAAAIVASRSLALRNVPERASLAVIESVFARLQGKSKDAVTAAHRAMVLINRLGSESLLGDQVYQLMSTCAVSFFRAGDSRGLWRVLGRVPVGRLRGGLMASSLAAVSAAAAGEWRKLAAIENTVAQAGWQDQELVGYRGALLQLASMLRDLSRADTESARARLRALGEHLPTLEFRVLFSAAEALAALIDGASEEAHLIVTEARRSERSAQRLSPNDAELLALVDALAAAAGGWTGAARKHLEAVSASSRWGRLLRAHLDLLQTDHAAAARHLAARSVAEATEPRLVRARFLLLAWLGLEAGETKAAGAALRRAGGITQVSGEDGSMMLIPDSIRHRLSGLLGDDSASAARAVQAQLMAPLPSPFSIVSPHPRLTKRELIVLSQLHAYGNNGELAAALNISPNTVKTQLRSAYRKLSATNREQALVRMAVLGIDDAASTSTGEVGEHSGSQG